MIVGGDDQAVLLPCYLLRRLCQELGDIVEMRHALNLDAQWYGPCALQESCRPRLRLCREIGPEDFLALRRHLPANHVIGMNFEIRRQSVRLPSHATKSFRRRVGDVVEPLRGDHDSGRRSAASDERRRDLRRGGQLDDPRFRRGAGHGWQLTECADQQHDECW